MSPIIRAFSMRRFCIVVLVAPCLVLSACSRQQPPEVPTAAAPSPAPVAQTPPPQDNAPSRYDAGLLMSKGVASADITVKSRGKQDATGDAVAAWQLDRRVEIDDRNAVASQ